MKVITILSVFAMALLAACASTKQAEQMQKEKLARYTPYLGKPVSQFTTYTHSDGWEPVDSEHVLVHSNFNETYLLTVAPACINLPFAFVRIGLVQRFPNIVSSGFDSIRVRGETCRILEIQPVDYKRMQADLNAQKKAA